MKTFPILLLLFMTFIHVKSSLRIVLLSEYEQPELTSWFSDALRNYELKHIGVNISDDFIQLNRAEENESYNKLCSSLSKGVSLLFDFTWSDWETGMNLLKQSGIPYIKSQAGSTIMVLQALLDVLDARNASDAVIIFQTETDLNQALYNIINKSILRILVVVGLSEENRDMVNKLRPTPGHFIMLGETSFIQESYKIAYKSDLLLLSDRWVLAFTDMNYDKLDTSILRPNTTLLSITPSTGCQLQDLEETCSVEKDFQIQFNIINKMVEQVLDTMTELMKNQEFNPISIDCAKQLDLTLDDSFKQKLIQELSANTVGDTSLFTWDNEGNSLYLRRHFNVQFGNSTQINDIAKWSSEHKFNLIQGAEIKPIRTFYRIGITESSMPWTYPKINPETSLVMLNEKGVPIYEGYCIDLIAKIAELMDFDYELVLPKQGTFGKKLPNGTWTGIIGDLISGDTDLAVAPTFMTSEREEVIDFVAPYFEQTGIAIIIRKPVRKTSLFKFMTVLKVEVWLSIVAALVITAILLSILDRYSPYSARNNKQQYSEICRDFTLKESFWFALTSFTPQGGGEAPKALSGRTLVAAYWLFVVLMLATFTANLAAFLTVERMQTPVSSLEQLARQSRINYTVVDGSIAHKYFINMKHAEDILYKVWKEITLNSSSDETIYHVWDYPIKEQYGHILMAIESANPVMTAREGFDKVDEHLNADFAFIHDAAEIKYEISRNCNITEVGEVFGERPYAMAVQQGSKIQDELSKIVLELQRIRFFEYLSAKYWNASAKGICPDGDESEGITLESLGGVFIATLFGLALAMVTLVWEIIYYKRKESKINAPLNTPEKKSKLLNISDKRQKKEKKDLFKRNITFGETFKPVTEKHKVAHINVEPKMAWNP